MKKFFKRFWWLILLLLAAIFATKKIIFHVMKKEHGLVGGARAACIINRIQPRFIEVSNKIFKEYFDKYNVNLLDRASSFYRCPDYNTKVGGVPNSSHVKGLAGDLKLNRKEAEQFIAIAKRHGVRRFLFKSRPQHLHYDIDGSKPAVESFS